MGSLISRFASRVSAVTTMVSLVVAFSFPTGIVLFPAGQVFADTASLIPSSEVAHSASGWTASGTDSAANRVSRVGADDGDTGYVSSSANNSYEVYGFPGASIPAGSTINSVTFSVVAKQSGSGSSSFSLIATKSGSATSSGSSITPTASYATYSYPLSNNPFTSSAWTVSEVNSWTSHFGFIRNNASASVRVSYAYVTVDYTLPTYTINASAGTGGSITPSGSVSVTSGTDKTFVIAPSTGYVVSDVSVDSASQGTINSYTFSNVGIGHSITAAFDSGWSAPSTNTNNNGVTNPGNAYSSNDGYAVFDSQDDQVDYGNFGLSIPAGSTINGIEVAVEGNRTDPRTLDISLSYDGGSHFTSAQNVGSTFTTADKTVLLGGTSNTWGHTWTSTQFTNGTFRVRANAVTSSPGDTLNLDELQVKVFYTNPDTTAPSGGSITYTDGYYTSASVPVTYTLGTDSGSGLNNSSGKIQRASATLSGGSCGTFGSFSDLVTESDGSYTDSTVTTGHCYKYQYLISDNSGNTATYTSVNVAKVDTVAPTVTNITSATANGSYPAGTIIPISVTFSENVNVTGTPTLVLSDGGTATYVSGSSGSALLYNYTVSSGENSSDLGVTSVGSGIADVAGNAANTSIPAGQNLSNNKDIVVDTTAPTISSIVTDAPSNPTNHSSFTVTVTFSEPVTDFDTTSVLDVSTNNGAIGNPLVVDSSHYEFDVSGYTEGDVTVTVHPGAVKDVAGNLNSADGSVSVTYDTHAPELQLTQEPIINGYASSTALSFTFTTDAASTSCQFDADYTSGCTSPFATTTAEGAHTLTIIGQDVAGNTTSVVRNFTVDVTPPAVSTAADMTVTATMPSGAIVTYSLPSAHDNFDASVTAALSCSPTSGSVFSIGDHAITCVARDAAGNEVDTAPFTTVHVVDLTSGAGLTIDGTQTNATADNTYTNGWHWTFHFKLPFSEKYFRMLFSDFTSGGNSITADNVRLCSEQSNMNCSDDAHYVNLTGANATSTAITFSSDSTGDIDSETSGRQADVKVEVKIPTTAVPGSYSASYGFEATSTAPTPPVFPLPLLN